MGGMHLIPWDRVMLSGITHVCVVVRDVKAAAGRYSELGIGPFKLREVQVPESRGTVRGLPASFSVRFAYAEAGAVMLELAQPLDETGLHAEFLASHGEGLHHIGFRGSQPLERELQVWSAAGIDALQVVRRDDERYGWAYLNTQSEVGCLLEVVCDPPLGWWDAQTLLGLAEPRHGCAGPANAPLDTR